MRIILKAIAYVVVPAIALSGAAFGQGEDKNKNDGSDGTLAPYESEFKTDESDPVLEKLKKDIAKYQAGLEANRDPIRKELEKRKEAAKNSGVLKKLAEATLDIEAFDECDKLPATLLATKPELAKQFRKKKEQLQQQMIRDFETAIKEYTRLGKLPEATGVKSSLEEFKASLRTPPSKQPPRRRRRR